MFGQPNRFINNEQPYPSTTDDFNWSLPPDIFAPDTSSTSLDSSTLSEPSFDLQFLLDPNTLFPSPTTNVEPINYLLGRPETDPTVSATAWSTSETIDLSWLNSYLPSHSPLPLGHSFSTTSPMAISDPLLAQGEAVKSEHGTANCIFNEVLAAMLPLSPPHSDISTPASASSSRSSTPDSLAPSVGDILSSCETLGISPSNLLTDIGSIPAPAKSIRNIAPKIYTCPIDGCNHTFTRVFNLRAHAKTHDPTRNRPFQCNECDKSFCRQHDLDRHSTVHSKVRAFTCSYCLRPFTRIDAKARHEREKCHVVKAIRDQPKVAAAVLAVVVANHNKPDTSG